MSTEQPARAHAWPLSHYRDETFELDRTFMYHQRAATAYGKPRGFWVSVDGEDDWPSWCTSEGYYLNGLTVHHRVALSPDANVLVLPSVEKMDVFAATYLVPSTFGHGVGIDWVRVSGRYDGIIIPVYQWSRRHRDWYYGWDCASGCIWNLDAIKSVTAVEAVAA